MSESILFSHKATQKNLVSHHRERHRNQVLRKTLFLFLKLFNEKHDKKLSDIAKGLIAIKSKLILSVILWTRNNLNSED